MMIVKNICFVIVVGTASLVGIGGLTLWGISTAADKERKEILEWKAEQDRKDEELNQAIEFLTEAAKAERAELEKRQQQNQQ